MAWLPLEEVQHIDLTGFNTLNCNVFIKAAKGAQRWPSSSFKPSPPQTCRQRVARPWPFLLDNRIRLQLVLQVMITGSQGVAAARILAYQFHTAGPGC